MSMREHEPLTQEERDLAQKLSRLDAHAGPSSALDAAILAAARDDAGASRGGTASAPRGRRRPRWPVGLGIAASLAVAVGVAWQLRPQPDTQVLSAPAEAELPAYSVAKPAPAAIDPAKQAPAGAAADRAADAAPAPAQARALPAPAIAEREQRKTAVEAERTEATREEAPAAAAVSPVAPQAAVDAPPPREPSAAAARLAESADVVFDVAPTPPPAPPAPPAATRAEPVFVPDPSAISGGAAARALRSDEAAGQRERMQPAVPAASARRDAAISVAVPSAPVALGARVEPAQEIDTLADQPLDDQPPASADSPQVRDAWLQRIRELRDSGALDEARASLREFVRRHPQAAVPDDLRPLLGE